MHQQFLTILPIAVLCITQFILAVSVTSAADLGIAEKYSAAVLEKNFTRFERPGISDVRAKYLMGVFAPILEGHPESMEGNARARILFEKTRDENSYIVDMELLGYLDDSVAGQQFVGFVGRAEVGGWQLESLWVRQKCARGKAKDKWVKGNCG
ncbi:MAG: hypothetical protein ACR2PG_07345 [Hyphomicrobiaceae bacterium]